VNLVILDEPDYIADNIVRLKDQRFTQISQVHRSAPGDTVRVGQLNGLMGTGKILALDEQSVEISVILDTPPPEKLPLTLVLALPRPKMLRRIFRSVTELGVEKLVLINSYKVEKSYWSSPALQPEKIRAGLIDGLQQARDTRLPEVQVKQRFKPFVEDELPAIVQGKQALVAHPCNEGMQPTTASQTVLAIGPEGGFIDYEIEKLQQAGFQVISFGSRIYRVENAISYAIGKLFG
jgi:16S rRNA (uracil1498-N3)-methyltransferase